MKYSIRRDSQNTPLLNYKELMNQIEKSGTPNHILLGNGFNISLGIKTSYSNIFSQMKTDYLGYQNIEQYLDKDSPDIEKLIGHLKGQVQSSNDNFLVDYIEQKIKLDFMKATNEIVQKSIKKVYQENNQGIYLFLKNFTNYFTLNYDPFLYLLLLKFKKDDAGNAIAFQNDFFFQEEDLNQRLRNIYAEIQEARRSGEIEISIIDNESHIVLKNTTKTSFESIIKEYNKERNKGWKVCDIKKVCDRIWKEENNQAVLAQVDDGFQAELFEKSNEQQNLYFLHGAFHIIKNKGAIQKITAKQNKSFCEKLEEAIQSEDKDIICVLANMSDEKKVQIEENSYLSKCFNNLSKIDGSLVILGSSLDKNDQHIFDQINDSRITNIYVSSSKGTKESVLQRAGSVFVGKDITLFDHGTISYKEGNNP